MVRLSAGRAQMNEGVQALCFLAGANSIFYGDTLLTTSNPQAAADRALLARLGIHAEAAPDLVTEQAGPCGDTGTRAGCDGRGGCGCGGGHGAHAHVDIVHN
jgi:biotin synthase